MKRKPLILILILLAAPVARAQITFDPSILQSLIGERLEIDIFTMDPEDIPDLTPILDATGDNQTYDFTPFTFFGPSLFETNILPSAAGTPGEGDPDFDGANYVHSDGAFYDYRQLTSDGFFVLGSINVLSTDTDGDGVPDQSISKNDPPDPIYRFPLTSQSAWNETIVSTSETSGSTGQVTITKDAVVEGWGTLITPAGSAEALRLRVTSTTESGGTSLTISNLLFLTNGPLGAGITFDSEGAVQPGGVTYSVTNGIATSVDEAPQRTFQLAPNYPNPFSGSTRIVFDMEQPGHATLRVFDLLGRPVATLVDEPRATGRHTVVWEAAAAPNGVYVYQLQTDRRIESKRMVLMR